MLQRHLYPLHAPTTQKSKTQRSNTCPEHQGATHPAVSCAPWAALSTCPPSQHLGAEGPQLTRTSLIGDQVLHNDIRHAIPVGVAVLVEPVHCAENQLVEGNGAILAAHHLRRASVSVLSLLRRTDRPHLPVRNKHQRFHWLNTAGRRSLTTWAVPQPTNSRFLPHSWSRASLYTSTPRRSAPQWPRAARRPW